MKTLISFIAIVTVVGFSAIIFLAVASWAFHYLFG